MWVLSVILSHLLIEAHHLIELDKLSHVLLMRVTVVVKVFQWKSLILRGILVWWDFLLRTTSPGMLLVIVHQFWISFNDTGQFDSLQGWMGWLYVFFFNASAIREGTVSSDAYHRIFGVEWASNKGVTWGFHFERRFMTDTIFQPLNSCASMRGSLWCYPEGRYSSFKIWCSFLRPYLKLNLLRGLRCKLEDLFSISCCVGILPCKIL